MAAAVVARSLLRSASASASASASTSTSVRASTCRIGLSISTSATRFPFSIRTQKPLSHRIFRSPVEITSFAVESLLPFHTATASALLASKLSTAPCRCSWLILIDDS